MSKTVTSDTIETILNEVNRACLERSRVISDIKDFYTQQIIQYSSNYAHRYGISSLGVAGMCTTGCIVAGIGSASASSIATGIGGVTGGYIASKSAFAVKHFSSSMTSIGLTGGSAASVEGAVIGATAGSVVPVVGTIIGLVVGLVIGGIIFSRTTAKSYQKREILYQEAIKKQSVEINQLYNEINYLRNKYYKLTSDVDRLEYLVGVVNAYSLFVA